MRVTSGLSTHHRIGNRYGPVHAAGAMLNARHLAVSCWAVALVWLAPIVWAGESRNAADIRHHDVLREEATIRVGGLTEK